MDSDKKEKIWKSRCEQISNSQATPARYEDMQPFPGAA